MVVVPDQGQRFVLSLVNRMAGSLRAETFCVALMLEGVRREGGEVEDHAGRI
jgi:hypothetical protein